MRKLLRYIATTNNYLLFLLVISASWSLFFFCKYIDNHIYDSYGFRQAQTAISVRYLLESTSIFSYETPVLGYPWSIPFEFPTYQILVRSLVESTPLSIESSGRIISFVFFILTALNGALVLRSINESKTTQLAFLILFFSSPLYIFWSRTVMIESTALFFSTLFLYLFIRLLNERKNRLYLYCLPIGALAALTKATTFAPFLVCSALFLIGHTYKERTPKKVMLFILRSCVLAIPIVITILWNAHADSLKLENPMSNGFIDSKSLTTWNFGRVSQKLSLDTWKRLTVYTNNITNSLWIVFILSATLFPFYKKKKRIILVFLASFFSAYIVFTNLHFVHAYYPYANGILLIMALALTIGQIAPKAQWLICGLLTLALALNYHELERTGHKWAQQTNDTVIKIGSFLRKQTPENSVILTTGLDWSSELPFEANRRALMLRPTLNDFDQKYMESRELLEKNGFSVSAFVDCAPSNLSTKVIRDYNLETAPLYTYEACFVYLLKN